MDFSAVAVATDLWCAGNVGDWLVGGGCYLVASDTIPVSSNAMEYPRPLSRFTSRWKNLPILLPEYIVDSMCTVFVRGVPSEREIGIIVVYRTCIRSFYPPTRPGVRSRRSWYRGRCV